MFVSEFGECTNMVLEALWFLAVLVGLPFPIMMLVDVERGHAEGIALARTLQHLDSGHHDLSTQSNDSESDLS